MRDHENLEKWQDAKEQIGILEIDFGGTGNWGK